MTNYPGICHLVSNSSVSLIFYQGDKRPGSFVICADLCGTARIGCARLAERVRQRGDSLPAKFIFNKTRAKQRRMSESVYLIREQGSGEPRALPSSLIALMTREKGDKLPGRSTSTRSVESARHEVPRFPAQEPAFCRFFRASLLCSGFIKNEFSRQRVTSLPHPLH